MEEVKHCQMCGCIISDANDPHADYFRHIRLQYCPSCRKLSDQLKTAARVKALRRRKRQKDKLRDEQLELLKEENRLLRNRVQQLRQQEAEQAPPEQLQCFATASQQRKV